MQSALGGLLVHDGIRHLEKTAAAFPIPHYVHDGIRHLEKIEMIKN